MKRGEIINASSPQTLSSIGDGREGVRAPSLENLLWFDLVGFSRIESDSVGFC
jgi:hypothetical protein